MAFQDILILSTGQSRTLSPIKTNVCFYTLIDSMYALGIQFNELHTGKFSKIRI